MKPYQFSDAERDFLEKMPAPLGVYQLVGKRMTALVFSLGFLRLFGYKDHAEAYASENRDMYGLIHPEDAARIADADMRFMEGGSRYELIYRTRTWNDPGYRVVHVIGEHVCPREGVDLSYVWYTDEGPYAGEQERQGRDELNMALTKALHEESVVQATYYDYLTGLPNMTYFFELADQGKVDILREGGWPVILYMDLSGMKYYNDRFGFAEGDKLLCEFAKLLVQTFGSNYCSRFGADQFTVLTGREGLEEILDRFFGDCETLNGGNSLPVRVGIYMAELGDATVSTACDRAKIACDALKGTFTSDRYYYSQDLQDEAMLGQYVLRNLDRAIENQWIRVYYQAIIRAADGKVCDEEALSRWIDPVMGFLSPADFIPVLEEAKMIYKLDLYVVECVLEKIKRQAEAGMYVVPQSVNLSRMDFDSCDIVEEIRRRVDEAGIDRSMLTIEITESVIGSDFEFIKEQIHRFRELGFPVWMDDFGSGYSSLDLLQDIQFDLIKFDMRFMSSFDRGEKSKIVLTELTRMAIGLGIETVCEGVERREQMEFLKEIGCTKTQGYYFSKPLPFEEILSLYESGIDMGFENPEEAGYYATLGKINLYDMAVISNGEAGDESLRRYFDTLPMAILEVNGSHAAYARCNKSYRDFMDRVFGVAMTGQESDCADMPRGHGAAFMNAVMRCSSDGNRAIIDEPVDENTTIHRFIRRVAVNPVTGTTAIAIAVLEVTEDNDSEGTTYENIARALSSDYINLYYVDIETEEFIEYTSDINRENLVMERRGADFFHASREDASLFVYKEDYDYFIGAFTKENVLRAMDEHATFTLTYRLLMDGEAVYVNMKAVRMHTDTKHIIIGVSNVDAQMRQKEEMARIKAEQRTYSRINALIQGFICIYTVDPLTGRYTEYSSMGDYAGLGLSKAGEDLFAQSRVESVRHVYPEDVEKFQTLFTRESLLEEIDKDGHFTLQYRMILNGEPRYVRMHAALVEEQDGPQLIIGVNDIDDQIRREQDYERRLSAARSRAGLDTLTGVKNRTAYDDMSQTLARQIQGGRTVKYAIALCRVQNLEEVNETRGHEAGDRMIRDACAMICDTFKHSPVFRVAADQFAAVAQGQDFEHADELLSELEERSRMNSSSGGVVVVCGMAKYDGRGNVTSVFERADEMCRKG